MVPPDTASPSGASAGASARSKARKRALDVLYASDLRGETPTAALERVVEDGPAPTHDYTAVLVRGVADHAERIDELIAGHAEGWTLERMPPVDRNALRLGVWELVWADDVPAPVAVSEAVALVRSLSTDESPTFVNGVLGSIQRSHPRG